MLKGAIFALRGELEFWLASSSPRRKQFLSELGLPYKIIAPEISEPALYGDARETAIRSARAKGLAALASLGKANNLVLLAADTVVGLDGQVYGKPKDSSQALAMLEKLNDREHEVFTALWIALREADMQKVHEMAECSQVRFGRWPRKVLEAYVSCGEAADKAGAYAIQGRGAFLIKSIRGSWSNVVGLPIEALTQWLLAEELISPVF